jgi:hypothetical protein
MRLAVRVFAVAAVVTMPVVGARGPDVPPGKRPLMIPVMGPGGGPGWSVFKASTDTRVVYVSASEGDDQNSGLSVELPVRSLGAAYERMRAGFPDWMLLKRGDTWVTPFPEWRKGGRQELEPMIVGSYGLGARPRIQTASAGGFFSFASSAERLAHFVMMDLHFWSDRPGGASPDAGITFLNNWENVLVENCRIEGFRDNIVVEWLESRPRGIRVRRNLILDSHSTAWFSQGLFAGGVDGLLIEENVFDHNGWLRGMPGAHATVFNHNMYLHGTCSNVTVRGNISARASATGASQRCAGISEDNLFLQNPTGLYYGGENAKAMESGRGAIRNNVLMDGRDIDSENQRGIGITIAGAEDVEVYGNIVSHQRTGTGNVLALDLGASLKSIGVYRNIIHDWTCTSTGLGMFIDLRQGLGVRVTDNSISQVHGGFVGAWIPNRGVDHGGVFGRNSYFTANPPPHEFYYGMLYGDWLNSSAEVHSLFAAPSFSSPERDIASYMMSLGRTPTIEAFLDAVRQQERSTWDPAFTAAAVCGYIRAGFGMGACSCLADFNRDGGVNAADMATFLSAAAQGLPEADLDLDGMVTELDVAEFQARFPAGCP